MCRLYGKFASYLRRVLCKTRLIFPRINGPIESVLFRIPQKCGWGIRQTGTQSFWVREDWGKVEECMDSWDRGDEGKRETFSF